MSPSLLLNSLAVLGSAGFLLLWWRRAHDGTVPHSELVCTCDHDRLAHSHINHGCLIGRVSARNALFDPCPCRWDGR